MGSEAESRTADGRAGIETEVSLTLNALPERNLIRPGGSHRHVVYVIKVGDLPPAPSARSPLRLALVLDRSGSMAGEKLDTAKRAALAVLDRLDEADQVSVVAFDNEIEVVQPLAPVTEKLRVAVRTALAKIEARASTALHEGWLTGCEAIASESSDDAKKANGSQLDLARCFLLTDGLANVGVADPEALATEAAEVREKAGIGTSTFGIGPDYDENLLGPLAVAGGGQFHHLRDAGDIAETFVGEVGELLAVAARQVRLELSVEPAVSVEVVSDYWAKPATPNQSVWSVAVGDLLGGESRQVVVRLGFPPKGGQTRQAIRAHLVWSTAGGERVGSWQEVAFSYASNRECDVEERDLEAMRWVASHHAERAKREAARNSRQGDLKGARYALSAVAGRISAYAGSDPALRAILAELADLEEKIGKAPVSSMVAKEHYYQSQRVSRSQRDHRPGSNPDDEARRATEEILRRCLPARTDWPSVVPPGRSRDTLADLYRGSLLWGAVGDALGRAAEGKNPATIRALFGAEGLRHYVPWHGWLSGPKGTITDDTQLTIEVVKSLLASRRQLDPDDLSRRLVDWLPNGRGKGRVTTQAVTALANGARWWQASSPDYSAGNGAAMRAAPVGLARALCLTPWPLRRDAVLSAYPTHAHPIGVAGAVVIAAGVAWCVRARLQGSRDLDRRGFLSFLAGSIEGMEPQPSQERRPGGGRVFLRDRILEIGDLAERATPEEAFAYTYNGAFALETVPAALYCFLRSPDDPRQVILTGVNGGYDADTVAAMAGNLAGAWNGLARLRAHGEWWTELEYRDELVALADGLTELALEEEGKDGDQR